MQNIIDTVDIKLFNLEVLSALAGSGPTQTYTFNNVKRALVVISARLRGEPEHTITCTSGTITEISTVSYKNSNVNDGIGTYIYLVEDIADGSVLDTWAKGDYKAYTILKAE